MIKDERGIYLIEFLLVVVVLGSIVFLIASIPNSLMLVGQAKHISLVREIAVKQIEDKRTIDYSNLVNGNGNITDSRISSLPAGSGTIDVSDCDPAVCTNGENIKQVKVTINWKDNNKMQAVKLQTMIGEGGINQ